MFRHGHHGGQRDSLPTGFRNKAGSETVASKVARQLSQAGSFFYDFAYRRWREGGANSLSPEAPEDCSLRDTRGFQPNSQRFATPTENWLFGS